MNMNSELALRKAKISGEKTETAKTEKSQHVRLCTNNNCSHGQHDNNSTNENSIINKKVF